MKFLNFILFLVWTKIKVKIMNKNYDNAPMMDIDEYNDNRDIDLNTVNGEVLDVFYRTQQLIWVTEIHLSKNNEIIYNYICPYIVIEDNGEYYLKNRTKVDTFVPYDVKLKKIQI